MVRLGFRRVRPQPGALMASWPGTASVSATTGRWWHFLPIHRNASRSNRYCCCWPVSISQTGQPANRLDGASALSILIAPHRSGLGELSSFAPSAPVTRSLVHDTQARPGPLVSLAFQGPASRPGDACTLKFGPGLHPDLGAAERAPTNMIN